MSNPILPVPGESPVIDDSDDFAIADGKPIDTPEPDDSSPYSNADLPEYDNHIDYGYGDDVDDAPAEDD